MVHSTALLVLLKYPDPGKVKTRLAARLGGEAAAELYRIFVEMTLQLCAQVPRVDYKIYFTPPEEELRFRQWLGEGLDYLPQPQGDLGLRLECGFQQLLRDYSQVIALGTDSPDLPVEYIVRAIEALQENDVVIGPALDGGYYLIGLRKPYFDLFQDIPWSTSKVFDMTFDKAKARGISPVILPGWYDIDTWEDLRRMQDSQNPVIQSLLDRYV